MKKITVVFTTLVIFISCQNKNSKEKIVSPFTLTEVDKISANYKPENSIAGFQSDSTATPQFEPEDQKKQPISSAPIPNPDWDKKIIKTASLNLEIKKYNEWNSSLKEKVKQLGGYIAQEEQTQSEYKIENTLTIKIPVDQFDNAINQLSTTVEKVNEKKITSQDVTGEVVDTKSRLEAKKQVRQRYMDLLKQAKNMEDILSVQSEIDDIQEEIESADGRINYLTHSAVFSTINLTFYQVLNPSAIDTDKPSFGHKLSDAFRNGWSWVGELLVGIISIWPLLLIIFTAFIIYKSVRTPKTKTV